MDSLEIYSDILMEQDHELDSVFSDRRSHLLQKAQNSFSQLALESIEIAASIDPYQSDLPEGVEVPAVDAVRWIKGHRNCDLRPRLVDDSTGVARLIDTGAQLSATKRLPTDVRDDSVNLVAVNGSRINTYGERDIEVKIGRKKYTIPAIVWMSSKTFWVSTLLISTS